MNFIKGTFLNVVEICMELKNHLISILFIYNMGGKNIEVVMACFKIQ